VIVRRLQTRAFRNLVDDVAEPHARFNVLHGDNAQGKTNIVEAIHLLLLQRSFRAGRVAEMIRFEHTAAEVAGDIDVDGLQRQVQVQLTTEGRRVVVDGKPTRAGSTKLDGLTAVLFCPADLHVPRGAPTDRRGLIDQAITTAWPGYRRLVRDYSRALAARNRLLRDHPPQLGRLLDAYDQQVATLGARLMVTRVRYLKTIEESFEQAFGRIAQTGVIGSLVYRTASALEGLQPDPVTVGAALAAELARQRAVDMARRTTSVGPHTDDIDFCLDRRSAKRFGSQGQLRSLVLAFKITQVIQGRANLGHDPVLLLDDVSSELDARRNGYLFDFLKENTAQVFITTTRPELIPIDKNILYFQIFNGSWSRRKSLVENSPTC